MPKAYACSSSGLTNGAFFSDQFDTLSLYNTRNTAAGGTWQPAGTFGQFVDGQDFDGVWVVNPFNPATPYNNIYTVSNSILSMRIDNSPNPSATGGDTLVGAQLHTFNTFQHSVQGYWEIRVAVPDLKGSNFAFWLADSSGKQQIAVFGGENAQDGTTFGNFNVWDPTTNPPSEVFSWFTYQQSNQALNQISNFHQWGLKITNTQVTNYIDRAAFVTTNLPSGYVNPMYMFLDWFTDGTNGPIAKPLTQPWLAQVDYVAYWTPGTEPVV